MAKQKKNKQKKKCNPTYKRVRNWLAVHAFNASGSGKHQDRRFKRRRTRKAQKTKAIDESLKQ